MKKSKCSIVAACAACFVFGFMVTGCRTRPKGMPYPPFNAERFWETNARPEVMGLLYKGVPEIPTIDAELQYVRAQIRAKYATEILVRKSTNYGKLVPDPFDAYVSNGVPVIEVFIPVLGDEYFYLSIMERTERYDTYLIIHLLHQLHRLQYNQVSSGDSRRESPKYWVRRQQLSWAVTCERVIVPLVEQYGARLSLGEQDLYELWIRSMHSTQTPLLDEYIRKKYMSHRPP